MSDVIEIFTDKIKLPKDNMREHIDRDALFELAEDIKKNGLISPITVRPLNGEYELVAGQRRYLAHNYAGLLKIKCIVRELSDEEALAIMTSENLARVDVNPIDEAKHIARMMSMCQDDVKKVAHLVNRGEQWVRDRVVIGGMPDYMQELIANGELKIGVALELVKIDDDGIRKMWTYQAARDGASIDLAKYWLMDYERRKLPGGEFSTGGNDGVIPEPPKAIMLRCAIDGHEYDARMFKTVFIYEGNVALFNAFVTELNNAPSET